MSLSGERINSEDLDIEDFEDDRYEEDEEYEYENEETTPVVTKSPLYLKNVEICKRQFKLVAYSGLFWLVFLLLIAGAFAAAYMQELVALEPTKWKSNPEKIIGLVLLVLFSLLALSRISSNLGIRKQFAPFSSEYSDQLPEKPNHVLRDLYVALHCKRCVHFWLTFLFQFLAFISAIYTLIGAGIYSAVKGNVSSMKIFAPDSWKKFFSEWPSHWTMWMVLVLGSCVVIFTMQYLVMNQLLKRRIRAIEEVYEREKLVNECLLSFKVNEINKKYKIFVFVVVCVLGCVLYIFFRKMICAMFDKSFSV